MKLIQKNVIINTGETWKQNISLLEDNKLPVDLTGFTGSSSIRLSPRHLSKIATPTVTFNSNRKLGKITLELTAVETNVLTSHSGYYDVFIYSSGGEATKVQEGNVTINYSIVQE